MSSFHLCKQKDSMQCGIACPSMICSYYNKEYSAVSYTHLFSICCPFIRYPCLKKPENTPLYRLSPYSANAVSYTHLDVYKRQKSYCDKSKSDILVSIAIKSAERVAAMLSAIFNVFPPYVKNVAMCFLSWLHFIELSICFEVCRRVVRRP